MSFIEATPQKSFLKSDKFRGRMLPLIFLAGLGLTVWVIANSLWDAARDNSANSDTSVAETGDRAPVPTGPEWAKIVADQRAAEAEEAEANPVGSWKMRGTVYDLLSLKPLPGCALDFVDNVAKSRAQAVTDSRGRYRITLPSLEKRGYAVAIAKPGYAAAYLNPGTEGVAEMPQAQRRELVQELARARAEPATVQPYDAATLETDFHLAPKR